MRNSHKLPTAALAVTIVVGGMWIPAPASAWGGCGGGSGGFERDWGAADCPYVVSRPVVWNRWAYYTPARHVNRYRYYR